VPEDGELIGQALIGLKPVNAWVHTYTKSQTPSTRSRGLGWRIHESVEDTKLSTNKQHSLCLVSHHHTPQGCDMSVDHVHKWTLVYVLEEALRQEGLVVPGTKVKKNIYIMSS